MYDTKFLPPNGKSENKDYWVLGSPFLLDYYTIYDTEKSHIGLIRSNPDAAKYDNDMVFDIIVYILFWVTLVSGCCCGCFCCCFHPCRKAWKAKKRGASSVRGSLAYN